MSKLIIVMFCQALVAYMFLWIDVSDMNYRYRPFSSCFRPDCTVFRLPILSRSFSVPAFPFSFPFDKKNVKMKMVEGFSRPFPTVFIPRCAGSIYDD